MYFARQLGVYTLSVYTRTLAKHLFSGYFPRYVLL